MAIQNRRGAYSDFDPQKLVPGEWAVVQSGDPNSESGKAVYMAFDVGDVQRMASTSSFIASTASTAALASPVAVTISSNTSFALSMASVKSA